MKQEIFQCLRQIVDTYGEQILEKSSRKRFAALLEDYTKTKYRKEVYLLCESLQLGVYRRLMQTDISTQGQNMCFKNLTEMYCLTESAARFVIEAWTQVISERRS